MNKLTLSFPFNFNTTNAIEVSAGNGGGAVAGITGGAGGTISNLKLTDNHSFVTYRLESGAGGLSGTGGAGGGVDGVVLAAPFATVQIRGLEGGSGLIGGGAGGNVHNVTGRVGVLTVEGGLGGTGGPIGGGAGGDIDLITITAGIMVQRIQAGPGGLSTLLGGGEGGSISNVKIVGDIGNFTRPFGLGDSAMGGLFAGAGGESAGVAGPAGSVTNVTATRIAAILAAGFSTNGGNLTNLNAVSALTNVHASVFGADVNGNGNFDFVDSPVVPNPNNGIFLLGDGDLALDGLILVLSAGLPAPLVPAPLKIITV
jgi:hypothetical protein